MTRCVRLGVRELEGNNERGRGEGGRGRERGKEGREGWRRESKIMRLVECNAVQLNEPRALWVGDENVSGLRRKRPSSRNVLH